MATVLPWWLKITQTAFVAVLIPTYWRQYGPGNFLWFSDVALLTSVPALWLESSALASTQAVGVLVPEAVWLTPVLLLIVSRTGYDRRAFRYQTIVSGLILLASWRLTSPQDNVNWVYSRRQDIRSPRGRALFVAGLMIAIPLTFLAPAHRVLKRLFPPPARLS